MRMSKNNSPENKPVRIEVPALQINRRHFIYTSALAASSLILPACVSTKPNIKSANNKLSIGGIGTDGKGASDIAGAAKDNNITALCDVDSQKLAKAKDKYPGARTYSDYRVMLEKEKELDCVTVSTPDLHHAPASMMAIKLGKNVYCQKPLTHTIAEARALRDAAREYKVITQMGNQGHSGEGNRQLCEMIWSGAIGEVREVHCFTDRSKGWWPQGMMRPEGSDPVPEHLNWDLWLGPAAVRPYVDVWPENVVMKRKRGGHVYHPFAWRGWWDFGCGALGDMGCHVMDGANWALHLGAPTKVELVSHSDLVPEMAPESSVVRYHFPARGHFSKRMPACTLTWYDSGQKPPKPEEMQENWEGSGSLFIGTKGKIICSTYGENPHLLPASKMKDYVKPPKTIPRVANNSPHDDWIQACKGGTPACSNFDVAAPFTEMVLLGNLAIRLGKTIEWDSKNMRCPNAPEAERLIRKQYRAGWSV
jgi:predicted dehydrogenase